MGVALYFISFVGHYSRKLLGIFLKSKDKAFAALKKFYAFVTTQTGKILKCLCRDNGGEFRSA